MRCKICGGEEFIYSWSSKMFFTSSGIDPFGTIMPETIEYDVVELVLVLCKNCKQVISPLRDLSEV